MWFLWVELVWGGVCVCGACVDRWGLCGRGFCGRSQKGVELKKGRSQKKFNLSLSFVIPVNKMNLKSLPVLNHIPYKSKELYLLHQRFKKAHLSIV